MSPSHYDPIWCTYVYKWQKVDHSSDPPTVSYHCSNISAGVEMLNRDKILHGLENV